MTFWPRDTLYRVAFLALPLILANASTPLLGLVDAALMGHQPDSRYLTATTLGGNLFSVVAWGFNFLVMATSASTAYIVGRSGFAAANRWLVRVFSLAGLLGLILLAASPWLIPVGLLFYSPGAEVEALIRSYLSIRVFGAPLALMNLALAGWFIGVQQTSVNLWATLTAQVVNIVLSLILVVGFGWAVQGVALGSVAGELSALTIYLGKANRFRRNRGTVATAGASDGGPPDFRLGYYVHLAIPLIVRTFTLLFAFSWFNRLGLSFGSDTVAANALLLGFLLVISSLLDGFANAGESLIGQARGEGNRVCALYALMASGYWTVITSLLLALVFALARVPLIELMTDLATVRAIALEHSLWLILMPLYTCWSYWLDGVYLGLQWVRPMRNLLLVCVFGVYLPATLVLPLSDNHWLWAVFTGLMISRAVLMIGYLRYGWRRLIFQ